MGLSKIEYDRLMARVRKTIEEELQSPDVVAGSGVWHALDRAFDRMDDETTLAAWLRERS